ncbi:2Fe-2S iron-sulfur cluster-binding protein [Caballeronia sp. LZ065]|uniref:2Fe-2S iron-sulfur cluster-binding protein n=1 Tax=Caballeronia sp. LZ065 TaxID=3038571 RepID=UPI00285B0CB7|nr:2Fe-2S iron-sulfur cluster-binding protein [Caballeronia sp. LZ065]MDR5779094.1 2Fe-2S iron-sulfur cluster-binding protein [Caballeronia sp. LZ065]
MEPDGHFIAVRDGESLLEAALRAGLSLPRSCRNGTCRACMCRLVDGVVSYRVDWPGLTREEQAQGWILPCVALARGNVTIDQPDTREAIAHTRPVRPRGF